LRQHLADGHVHHGGEVCEPAGHRDVGGIQRPDLFGLRDGQLPQQVGVRAEHIQILADGADTGSHPGAHILRIELPGDQTLVHLRLDGSEHDLIVAVPPGHAAEPGTNVHLKVVQSLWFDVCGQRLRN